MLLHCTHFIIIMFMSYSAECKGAKCCFLKRAPLLHQLIEITAFVLARISLISVKHVIFMGLNRNKMKEKFI